MKDRRSELPQSRDPIFVRATGSGPGGIATLVVDGNGCISLLEPVLQSKKSLRGLPAGELGHHGKYDLCKHNAGALQLQQFLFHLRHFREKDVVF